MKKIILSSLLVFWGLILTAQNSFEKVQIQVLPSSSLSINGDTNINKFECVFNSSFLKESQAIYYSRRGSKVKFTGALLTLDNRGFDCGSKGINRDFHDLLRTKEHPQILLELSKVELLSPQKGIATICITLAGIQNFYEVPVAINTKETANFKGVLQLDINDYNLHAPTKLFGMIVVKDDIEIKFDLHVKTKQHEN